MHPSYLIQQNLVKKNESRGGQFPSPPIKQPYGISASIYITNKVSDICGNTQFSLIEISG